MADNTCLVNEAARKNRQRIVDEEAKKLKLEKKTIKEKSLYKIRRENRFKEEEQIRDTQITEYESEGSDIRPILPNYTVKTKVERVTHLKHSPPYPPNPEPCATNITKQELIEYVEQVQPEYLSFGDHPKKGSGSLAYHAKRINNLSTDANIYKAYTTSLYLPMNRRNNNYAVSRKKGNKQEREVRALVYDNLSNSRVYETDSGTAMIRNIYKEGMIVDPETLIAIVKRRENCLGSKDRVSYRIFEGWTAEVLELRQDAALAYYAGILDDPDDASGRYSNCRAANLDCRVEMMAYIRLIAESYWMV